MCVSGGGEGSPWKLGVNPLRALDLKESARDRRQTRESECHHRQPVLPSASTETQESLPRLALGQLPPPFSNTRKEPLRLPGHWGPGLPPPPEARAVRGARPHRPPLKQPLPGSGAGAAGRALTGRFSLMASTGW